MSVGLGLLHRLLVDGRQISELMEAEITLDTLDTQEGRVYAYIEEHLALHEVMPKIETVEAELEFKFPKFPDEPFGYWLTGVERRAQTKVILDGCKDMKDAVTDGDLGLAKTKARDLVLLLDRRDPVDRVTTMQAIAPSVLSEHDIRQRRGTVSGIPFGMEYLDRVSDGAQGGDTVAVVGRPGVGKSYFMLEMARKGYHGGAGSPLVATFEMKPFQCVRRLIALETGVSATMIRLGKLSHWGRERVAEGVTSIQLGQRPFYILEGGLRTTVEDLALRVQELRPNALYVDGAYLLRTRSKAGSARWERVAETAEVLKMIAREFNIPVIETYQFNRRGPGSLGNIGGSDAVGQLASIVIALDDEQQGGHTMWAARQFKLMKLLKGREGERGTIRVLYDMERMLIRQEEVLSGYEDETTTEEGE